MVESSPLCRGCNGWRTKRHSGAVILSQKQKENRVSWFSGFMLLIASMSNLLIWDARSPGCSSSNESSFFHSAPVPALVMRVINAKISSLVTSVTPVPTDTEGTLHRVSVWKTLRIPSKSVRRLTSAKRGSAAVIQIHNVSTQMWVVGRPIL